MRIAKIVGTVTLNRCLPEFVGCTLKMAAPYAFDALVADTEPQGPTVVVWDEMGADIGSRIAVAEGPEASQPFRPLIKPVDAYNAVILDEVHLDPALRTKK